jgi:hypothetical protein
VFSTILRSKIVENTAPKKFIWRQKPTNNTFGSADSTDFASQNQWNRRSKKIRCRLRRQNSLMPS